MKGPIFRSRRALGAMLAVAAALAGGFALSPTPAYAGSGFGTFKTQGAGTSGNTVSIVATHPALSGLTDADLSNWSDSVHEGFTAWPSSFLPLAVATDTGLPHNFTAADGTRGFPYILARGATPRPGGILKVCKVAGLGVALGTPFSFTAGASSFTVEMPALYTVMVGCATIPAIRQGPCDLGPRTSTIEWRWATSRPRRSRSSTTAASSPLRLERPCSTTDPRPAVEPRSGAVPRPRRPHGSFSPDSSLLAER